VIGNDRPIATPDRSGPARPGHRPARFTERFKELIESGYGLTDQEATSALNGSQPQPQVV
jgi:hypothetical protein